MQIKTTKKNRKRQKQKERIAAYAELWKAGRAPGLETDVPETETDRQAREHMKNL